MKNKEELLIKQAKEGYTVCYIERRLYRMLYRPVPIAQPVPAMACRAARAPYRQYLPMCQSALRGCGDCSLPDVSQRPEGTLRQRYDENFHKRHAQARRARRPSGHNRPHQPHLLLRVSQWFTPHPTSPAGRHPEPVPH